MDTKNMDYRRTRFVFSYFDKKKKINEKLDEWQKIHEDNSVMNDGQQDYSFIKNKRLFKHLDDNLAILFSDDVGICSFYRLKKDKYIENGIHSTELEISYSRNNEKTNVFDNKRIVIDDIFKVCFSNGLNMLILEISYGADCTVKDIANISFVISRVKMRSNNGNVDKYINSNIIYSKDGKIMELNSQEYIKNMIKRLVNYEKLDKYAMSKKIDVFHNLIVNQNDYNASIELYQCLAQGREYISSHQNDSRENIEKKVKCTQLKDSKWFISSHGIASVATYDCDNKSFVENEYRYNVFGSYFLIFLYVLYEVRMIKKYNIKMISEYSNDKAMIELREDMIYFNAICGFNVISEENNYQDFYDNVYTVYGLDKLEKESQDNIKKLAEYAEKKKKEETDNMFAILKWFSFISAIGTCASLWLNLNGENTKVYMCALIVIVVFAIASCFKVKVSKFLKKK